MSDTRFDGKHIYTFMSALRKPAVYVIRGKHIYAVGSAGEPEFEIRGTVIHGVDGWSKPRFRIHGNKIRKLHSVGQALYEIR